MDVTIRPACPADADAVSALYLRARRTAAARGSIPPPAHPDDEVAEWISRVVIPTSDCWLALSEPHQTVGLLVLNGDWIDQLYVDPDLTGRGIGAHLLERAKQRSPGHLRLWTFVSNDGAQRFYERHGFVEVERTDGRDNEEQAPDVLYAWPGPPSP